jgi:hypothetical protein
MSEAEQQLGDGSTVIKGEYTFALRLGDELLPGETDQRKALPGKPELKARRTLLN